MSSCIFLSEDYRIIINQRGLVGSWFMQIGYEYCWPFAIKVKLYERHGSVAAVGQTDAHTHSQKK